MRKTLDTLPITGYIIYVKREKDDEKTATV